MAGRGWKEIGIFLQASTVKHPILFLVPYNLLFSINEVKWPEKRRSYKTATHHSKYIDIFLMSVHDSRILKKF